MDPNLNLHLLEAEPVEINLGIYENPSDEITKIEPLVTEYKNWECTEDLIEYLLKSDRYVSDKIFEKFLEVSEKLGTIDDSLFSRYRDRASIFSQLDKINPFQNRAGLKFANSDAVYNLTKGKYSFLSRRDEEPFTYCDVASGPGSFTQYIQYRRPNSYGYGITLTMPKTSNLNWDFKIINKKKFEPFYGQDKTGDIFKYWREFSDHVVSVNGKVDLVTGDGGFDIERKKIQEYMSARLLLHQCLIALKVLKKGGNFFQKYFGGITEHSIQLIYILTLCFDKVILFKPVTSRSINLERYMICLGAKAYLEPYIMLLENLTSYDTETLFDKSIMPKNFINWIILQNNIFYENVSRARLDVFDKVDNRKSHIFSNFLISWNLPEKERRKLRLYKLNFKNLPNCDLYSYIKKGIKTVEGRPYKPLYESMKAGDALLLIASEGTLKCKITRVSFYKTIGDFLKKETIRKTMPCARNELKAVSFYNTYSSPKDREILYKKYGYSFVGIGIKFIKEL